MVLSSGSALVPETSTPSPDVTRGTTPKSGADDAQNPGGVEEGDGPVLQTPRIILDGKWSSLQVDPQSMPKSEAFQVAFISLAEHLSHSSDSEASHVLPLR